MIGWDCAVCNQDFDPVFKKSSTLAKSQQKLWKIFCDYFINNCKPIEDGQRNHVIQSSTTRRPNKNNTHENHNNISSVNLDQDLDLINSTSTGSQYSFIPFCPDCQQHIAELNRLDSLLGEIHQQIKTVSAHISATLVQSFDPSSRSFTSVDNTDDNNSCNTINRRKVNEKDVNFTRRVNTIIKDTRRTIYQNYQPFVLLRSDNDDKITNDGTTTTRNESYNVTESPTNICLPQPPSIDHINNILIKQEHVLLPQTTDILQDIPSTSSIDSDTCSSPFVTTTTCIDEPNPHSSSSNSNTTTNNNNDDSCGSIVSFHCDKIPEHIGMQHENEFPENGFFMNCSDGEEDDDDDEQDYDCTERISGDENDEYLQQYFSENEDSHTNVIVQHSSFSSASEDCSRIVNDNEDDADGNYSSNDLIINDAHNDNEDYQQYNNNIPIHSNADTQPTSIGFSQVDDDSNQEENQQNETSNHLIMSVEEIRSLTLQEILDRLSGYNITKEQISMIKNIQRKERNRISAMKSRQRVFERVNQLQQELQKFKGGNTITTTTQKPKKTSRPQNKTIGSSSQKSRRKTALKPRSSILPQVPSSAPTFEDCILVNDDDITEETVVNTVENYDDGNNQTQFLNCSTDTVTSLIVQIEEGIQVMDPNTNSRGLIISIEDIKNLPLHEIFTRLTPFNLSQTQRSQIRKIRRKEKNRICARNSRARFQSRVSELQREVDRCRERKFGLIEERKQLLRNRDKLNADYKVLYQAIIKGLLKQSGVDLNTNSLDYDLKELKNGEFALEPKQHSATSHHTFNPTGALDLTLNETTYDGGMDLSLSNLNHIPSTTAVKIEYD